MVFYCNKCKSVVLIDNECESDSHTCPHCGANLENKNISSEDWNCAMSEDGKRRLLEEWASEAKASYFKPVSSSNFKSYLNRKNLIIALIVLVVVVFLFRSCEQSTHKTKSSSYKEKKESSVIFKTAKSISDCHIKYDKDGINILFSVLDANGDEIRSYITTEIEILDCKGKKVFGKHLELSPEDYTYWFDSKDNEYMYATIVIKHKQIIGATSGKGRLTIKVFSGTLPISTNTLDVDLE